MSRQPESEFMDKLKLNIDKGIDYKSAPTWVFKQAFKYLLNKVPGIV